MFVVNRHEYLLSQLVEMYTKYAVMEDEDINGRLSDSLEVGLKLALINVRHIQSFVSSRVDNSVHRLVGLMDEKPTDVDMRENPGIHGQTALDVELKEKEKERKDLRTSKLVDQAIVSGSGRPYGPARTRTGFGRGRGRGMYRRPAYARPGGSSFRGRFDQRAGSNRGTTQEKGGRGGRH